MTSAGIKTISFVLFVVLLIATPCCALLEWQPTNGPWGGHVLCITISKNGTIYVGTVGGGVYKSVNGGASWESISAGFANSSKMINCMAVSSGDSYSSEHIFVGTEGHGVYKSVNGGGYWTSVNNNIDDYNIRAILADPVNNNYVYAGTTGFGIDVSSDECASWHRSELNYLGEIWSIAGVSVEGISKIYAGTAGQGIWRSTDKGAIWTDLTSAVTNLQGVPILSIAVSPSSPEIIYASTGDLNAGNKHEIWVSTNEGTSWNLILDNVIDRTYPRIAVDPASAEVVYAVYGGGLLSTFEYKSVNGGTSWSTIPFGRGENSFFGIAADPNDPSKLFAVNAGSGIYRSTNHGTSWEVKNIGLNNLLISALEITAESGQTVIYAAPFAHFHGFDVSTQGSLISHENCLGIFKSSDEGSSWIEINNGFKRSYGAGFIAISPADPKKIYITAGINRNDVIPSSECLWKTIDGGGSWQNVPVPGIGMIRAIQIDPRTSETLYLFANPDNDPQCRRSTDEGATWQDWGGPELAGAGRFLSFYPDYIGAGERQMNASAGTNETVVHVGFYLGAHKSFRKFSSGSAWEELPNFGTDWGWRRILDVPGTTEIYATHSAGIFRRSLYATPETAWKKISSSAALWDLSTDPGNLSAAYATKGDRSGITTAVLLSLDYANSFAAQNSGLPPLYDSLPFNVRVDLNSSPSSRIVYSTPPMRGVWKARTVAIDTPFGPINFGGNAVSTREINWTWVNNSYNELGFKVYDDVGNIKGVTAKNVVTTLETGLLVNSPYTRKVKSFNAAAESDPSNSCVTFTLAKVPGTPEAKYIGRQNITITWEANGNPSNTNYEIFRSTTEAGSGLPIYWQYVSVIGTTEYPDTGLTFETTYYYRVRALNGDLIPTGFVTSEGFITGPPIPSDDVLPPVITKVRFDDRMYFSGDIIYHTPRISALITDYASSDAPYFVTPEGVDRNSVKFRFDDYVFDVPLANVAPQGGPITVEVNYQLPTRLGSSTYVCTIEATDNAFPWFNKGTWTGKVTVKGDRISLVGEPLAYPMPFRPQTDKIVTMSYTLSTNSDVTIYMYNVSGQIIMTRKFRSGGNGGKAGYNQFTWNGITDFGNTVGNGICVYKIISKGKLIGTGKMVVLD